MLYDPFILDSIIKERQREILEQVRITSQLREANGAKPRENGNLVSVVSRVKSIVSLGAIRKDKTMRTEDCMPTPECQAC